MLDITAPEHGVEVSWSENEKVLWVNVDGKCVLRVCRIPDRRLFISYPDMTTFECSYNCKHTFTLPTKYGGMFSDTPEVSCPWCDSNCWPTEKKES